MDDIKAVQGGGGAEIGLEEFVIAQRAARRMKEWFRLAKEAKDKADAEAAAQSKELQKVETDKYGVPIQNMGASS